MTRKQIMRIGDPEWHRILETGADAFGISLPVCARQLLTDYAANLVQWNQTVNLTAITEPFEVAVKHLVDAMAVVPFLPENAVVVDIGSGGGIPGIPVRILRPDLTVVMVDSVRKKTSFTAHVLRLLKLAGSHSVHARIENFDFRKYAPEGFDIAMSRAFSDVSAMMAASAPLIRENGRIVTMKAQQAEQDIAFFVENVPEMFRGRGGWLARYSYSLPVISHPRMILAGGFAPAPADDAEIPDIFSRGGVQVIV